MIERSSGGNLGDFRERGLLQPLRCEKRGADVFTTRAPRVA
jgi:hypothetical protein